VVLLEEGSHPEEGHADEYCWHKQPRVPASGRRPGPAGQKLGEAGEQGGHGSDQHRARDKTRCDGHGIFS